MLLSEAPMIDQKKVDEIIAQLIRNNTPRSLREPATREELEQRAKQEAEEEAKQEAQKAYDETYEDAYNRILDELLDEHGFSDC
jgi:hypothetical protein